MVNQQYSAMYSILEKIAQKEIGKDPIGYIREQSFQTEDVAP